MIQYALNSRNTATCHYRSFVAFIRLHIYLLDSWLYERSRELVCRSKGVRILVVVGQQRYDDDVEKVRQNLL